MARRFSPSNVRRHRLAIWQSGNLKGRNPMIDKRNLTTTTGAGNGLVTKDTGPAVHPADRQFEAVLKGKAARARRPDAPPRAAIIPAAPPSRGEYLPHLYFTVQRARPP